MTTRMAHEIPVAKIQIGWRNTDAKMDAKMSIWTGRKGKGEDKLRDYDKMIAGRGVIEGIGKKNGDHEIYAFRRVGLM
jgi:hypothetical protein